MELKEIVQFYENNLRPVIISLIFTTLLGALAYFYLPVRYQAIGSLFVKRVVYPFSEDHFTYEGYYGQQAAVSYTDSVIGLIKSIDVQAAALKKLALPVDDKNLRQLEKMTRITKSGPQVVTVYVKENSPEKAAQTWRALTEATITTAEQLKSGGDPYMNVAKVSQEPVVKEGYRNLPVFSLIGLALGFLLSSFILAIKTYFSKNSDKK